MNPRQLIFSLFTVEFLLVGTLAFASPSIPRSWVSRGTHTSNLDKRSTNQFENKLRAMDAGPENDHSDEEPPSKLIDGNAIAAQIREEVTDGVVALAKVSSSLGGDPIVPALAVILGMLARWSVLPHIIKPPHLLDWVSRS